MMWNHRFLVVFNYPLELSFLLQILLINEKYNNVSYDIIAIKKTQGLQQHLACKMIMNM